MLIEVGKCEFEDGVHNDLSRKGETYTISHFYEGSQCRLVKLGVQVQLKHADTLSTYTRWHNRIH